MPETLNVALDNHSYDIVVGERLLAKAGNTIKPLLPGNQVIVISDTQVAKLYLHRLTGALEEAGIRARSIIVAPGEATKSLSSFSTLMEQLLEQKPDRKTVLIALGGGVVGDLTGFAASVLLRGVPFIQIPTTLLAQVDSSVGGKTGINSNFGKNLIGAFHQPLLVLSDVATLSSLPKRELLAGYAEVLKYGLINDPAFFEWLDKNAAALLAGDADLQAQAIVQSCKAKAAIVEAECGYNDTLLHGEAVAIGMMMAFKASAKMGLCPEQDVKKLEAHYDKTGLPKTPKAIRPDWDVNALMEHFTRDKKAEAGALTFILARGIGKAFVEKKVDAQKIRELLPALL